MVQELRADAAAVRWLFGSLKGKSEGVTTWFWAVVLCCTSSYVKAYVCSTCKAIELESEQGTVSKFDI